MNSARSIANSFLDLAVQSEQSLTNMQLQKLVYFAHGWHLALTGQPLLTDAVKAWDFGPVIPPLYNSLRMYGTGIVTEPIKRKNPDTEEISEVREPESEYVKKLLLRVWQVYRNMTGIEMSYLTHQPETPWDITWRKEKYSIISDELIKEHFQSLKAKSDAEQRTAV